MSFTRDQEIRQVLTFAVQSAGFANLVVGAPSGAAEKAAISWLRQFEQDFKVTDVDIVFTSTGVLEQVTVTYSEEPGVADARSITIVP
jgi:DNA-binding transcriptional LysR family regulator